LQEPGKRKYDLLISQCYHGSTRKGFRRKRRRPLKRSKILTGNDWEAERARRHGKENIKFPMG
jgi:hypothetical protein